MTVAGPLTGALDGLDWSLEPGAAVKVTTRDQVPSPSPEEPIEATFLKRSER